MEKNARPVRMLDVAESLGLSRATVSLVMRDSPLVAPATKDAVLRQAERLGYVYHRGAASLRTQSSDVVGLVMPDVINPFVSEVSVGAQDVLAEHGFFVVIANTKDRLESQRQVIRTMIEQRVAGVITIPVLDTDGSHAPELTQASVPIVLLTRDLPETGLPFVGPDDRAIGRIGARHLVDDHGCRTVAYFNGNTIAAPRIIRERSFRRAIGKSAEIIPEWNTPGAASLHSAYLKATELLDQVPPPEGLLCHSDAVAYGVLRALYEHGIGPDECRVLGIDNHGYAADRIPSLSTVAVYPGELGRVSARTLLHRLGHQEVKPGKAPRPELIRRESCGCVAPPTRRRTKIKSRDRKPIRKAG